MSRLLIIKVSITALLLVFTADIFAQHNPAREVYEEMDRRERSVEYESATIEMRIIDRRERVRQREIQLWSANKGDISRTMIRFLSPADVRGTGFLNISEGGADVQRLYLPALNRIQTIQSSQRNDSFMGSDFTYDDMGERNPDDYDFELIEEWADENRMLIRGTPKKDENFAYAHFLIDTQKYVLIKATYFDSGDSATRELTTDDISEITDGIWRANLLTMRDLKAGRRTELRWKSRTINEPIDSAVFTERNLSRF